MNLPATQQLSVAPTSMDDAKEKAMMIINGGFAPKGMTQPQQVLGAIMKGHEIGLNPMQAVQSIAMINGRASIWGDAAMALVQSSGLLTDVLEEITGEGEQMQATCSVERKDRKTPTTRTFSVEDAKTAGLWNKQGPWKQYPKRMLQMRARGFALRDGFPDVLNGLHMTEEVQDYPVSVIEPQPIEQRAAISLEAPTNDGVDVSTDETPIEQQAEAAAKKGLQTYTDFFTALPNEQKKMLVDAGYHETFKEIAEAIE